MSTSPATMPPTVPAHHPRDHAVVVGIDDYRADFEPLQGAKRDAEAFRDWLVAPDGGGLPPDNVQLLLSEVQGDNVRPNKSAVEDALLVHFRKRVQEDIKPVGRRLYLYLAGHGAAARDLTDECLLLMADADILTPGRSIPGRRTAQGFRACALFEEVVLFMDCCRDLPTQQVATGLSFEALIEDLQADEPGARWLFGLATQSTRSSREIPLSVNGAAPQVKGAFTHALLDGLRHATDDIGSVTAASLKPHVVALTERLTAGTEIQTPEILFDENIVFSDDQRHRVPVRVELQDRNAGFVVYLGDLSATLDGPRRKLAAGLWEIRLPPGRYLFAVPGPGGTFRSSRIVNVLGEVDRVEL